jgi:hypothetical protein
VWRTISRSPPTTARDGPRELIGECDPSRASDHDSDPQRPDGPERDTW